MQPIQLSIIVPVYKQEKTIKRDLEYIKSVVEKIRYKSEIICVIDGEVDNSFAIAKKFSREHSNIRVIGYPTNKGKGNAVRYGMAHSSGKIIAFIDSGMDINPNGLSMLLEHFEWYKADIIVGSKLHPVSKVSYPWQRRILSLLYRILIRLLFGLKIKDTQAGIKFFDRKVLEKVLPRLIIKKFAFDIEILSVANYLGFNRIFEAPIDVSLDFGGGSIITSKKFLKHIFSMLYDTFAVFYRLKITKYYSDENVRKWIFDPELNFKVNI